MIFKGRGPVYGVEVYLYNHEDGLLPTYRRRDVRRVIAHSFNVGRLGIRRESGPHTYGDPDVSRLFPAQVTNSRKLDRCARATRGQRP